MCPDTEDEQELPGLLDESSDEELDAFGVLTARKGKTRRGESYLANESSNSSSADEGVGMAAVVPGLSRTQRKALDKEIPWRRLMCAPPAVIEAFRRGVESEWTEHMKWGALKEVPETKVKWVLGSQQRRRRILRSRFCYRDKNCGLGDLKARCRMCVCGSADPDLPLLVRDALGLGRKPITPLHPLSHPTSPG